MKSRVTRRTDCSAGSSAGRWARSSMRESLRFLPAAAIASSLPEKLVRDGAGGQEGDAG